MKKTSLFSLFIIFLLMMSCTHNPVNETGKLPDTDSEILRSRSFTFEAVQSCFGKDIFFSASVVGMKGEIVISAGTGSDTYTFSDGEIYQIKSGVGEIKITETDAGLSLLRLINTLCDCPDAGSTESSGAVFSFSENGKRLISVSSDDIVLLVSKITYTENAGQTSA